MESLSLLFVDVLFVLGRFDSYSVLFRVLSRVQIETSDIDACVCIHIEKENARGLTSA